MKKLIVFAKVCFFVITIFYSVNCLIAQKPYNYKFSDPILDKYRWRHFKELSGKNFTFFCEQNNGTMWFGIDNGISSYDGYKWTDYLIPQEKRGNGQIRAMVFLGDTLFIAGNYGIQTFYKGEWSELKFEKKYITKLKNSGTKDKVGFRDLKISNGAILGATVLGLYIRKNGRDHFYTNQDVKLTHDTISYGIKYHIVSVFGKGFKCYFSNILDCGDSTYFGFMTSGTQKNYFKFKLTSDDNNPIEFIDVKISGIIEAGGPIASVKRPNGEIWIVSESHTKGLNILRNDKCEYFSFKKNLNDSEVSWNIVNLSDNSILITSIGLIYRYYNNQWSKITSPDINFKTKHVNAHFTRSGDLWLGDERGEVYKVNYSTKHWSNYRNLNYQFTNSDSSLWFLSDDNKVVYKKAANWYYYDQTDGLPLYPQTLYLAKNGTIWCGGTHNESSATAYLKNNKWVIQKHPTLSWGVNYNAFAEDNKGDIWVGGAADPKGDIGQIGGAIKIHPDINNFMISFFHKGRPFINSFAFNNDNYLYLGTDIGLKTMKDNMISNIALDNTKCNRLIKASSGSIWITSHGKGILKLFNNNDTAFSTNQGLISNIIYDLYVLNDSAVWAATNEGYSYYNGRYWINNIYPHEFNIESENGKLSGVGNNIWISKFPLKWTRRAYNMVNLDYSMDNFFSVMYKRDTMQPETQITFYYEKVQSAGNTSIEWTGIDYMNHTLKNDLYYSYRLNNLDWSAPTLKTNINYLGLKPGSYVFEVKAIDTDMNEDQTPAVVQFKVARPVWLQAWFIILILSLLSVIVYLYIRIIRRNNKLAELNQNLEFSQSEILKQNTRIQKQKDKLIILNKTVKKINKLRIKFFTNVSHEFRTPLTLILAPVEKILTNWKGDDMVYNQLLVVKRNSYRLMHLINELMDFSKIERKMLNPKLSQGNIIKFIEDIAEAFSVLATQRGITLKVNSEIKELDTWFDYEIVEKLLYNLISNAFKYSNNNGIIEISTRIILYQEPSSENETIISYENAVPGWKYIEIKVKDTGIGIAPENLKDIFKEFYRVESSKNKSFGTGIGLSLTKQLIKVYQGSISVESQLNIGSAFTIILPIDERFINEKEKETKTSFESEAINNQVSILTDAFDAIIKNETKQEDLTSKTKQDTDRILIVEDNDELRNFMINHFSALYNISEASNGVEGLKVAIDDSPQIIISDVMMPEMNGIELCAKLKNDLQTSHIPVILLTALSDIENQMKGLETGADDYIPKPFNINILSLKVQNLLESRKKLRKLFDKNLVVDSKTITTNSKDELFLQKALEVVNKNISSSEFDAKEFAEQMAVSQSLLYKKLINLTNQPISDFIFSIRMKKAAQLMSNQNLNFTEIANELGFTDSRYFSSCFKKYFNKTPSEYRADLL